MFVFNGVVALYTALACSREVWAAFNGLIAYVLVGALIAGEWLYRRVFITPRMLARESVELPR
jgi:uncharacterized membrane protein